MSGDCPQGSTDASVQGRGLAMVDEQNQRADDESSWSCEQRALSPMQSSEIPSERPQRSNCRAMTPRGMGSRVPGAEASGGPEPWAAEVSHLRHLLDEERAARGRQEMRFQRNVERCATDVIQQKLEACVEPLRQELERVIMGQSQLEEQLQQVTDAAQRDVTEIRTLPQGQPSCSEITTIVTQTAEDTCSRLIEEATARISQEHTSREQFDQFANLLDTRVKGLEEESIVLRNQLKHLSDTLTKLQEEADRRNLMIEAVKAAVEGFNACEELAAQHHRQIQELTTGACFERRSRSVSGAASPTASRGSVVEAKQQHFSERCAEVQTSVKTLTEQVQGLQRSLAEPPLFDLNAGSGTESQKSSWPTDSQTEPPQAESPPPPNIQMLHRPEVVPPSTTKSSTTSSRTSLHSVSPKQPLSRASLVERPTRVSRLAAPPPMAGPQVQSPVHTQPGFPSPLPVAVLQTAPACVPVRSRSPRSEPLMTAPILVAPFLQTSLPCSASSSCEVPTVSHLPRTMPAQTPWTPPVAGPIGVRAQSRSALSPTLSPRGRAVDKQAFFRCHSTYSGGSLSPQCRPIFL